MNNPALRARIISLHACPEAVDWLGVRDLAEAWGACPRADRMLELAELAGIDPRILQLVAADIAEDVLPIYTAAYPDDARPRQAIETRRRWARGEATLAELTAAREAAEDAAEDAAPSAAREAASAASRNAAGYAAEAAGWAVASAARWAAAEAAAPSAARAARRAVAMTVAADAAAAAAWDAAEDAGWAAARDSAEDAGVVAMAAALARYADMVRARISVEMIETAMTA